MNQRKPLFKERKNNLSQQFPLLSKHSDTVYPHKDKRSFIKENTMALHFPNTIHCTHKETKGMGGATGSPGRNHSGRGARFVLSKVKLLGDWQIEQKEDQIPKRGHGNWAQNSFYQALEMAWWMKCLLYKHKDLSSEFGSLDHGVPPPAPACMCPVPTQAYACRDTDKHTHTCMLVHTQLTKLDKISICLELQMQCVFICTLVALAVWAYYSTHMSAVTKLKRFHSWQT